MKGGVDMQSKAAFVLVLIGVIFGFISSIGGLIGYFVLKSAGGNVLMGSFGINFGALAIWTLIVAIIGLVLTIISLIYLMKIKVKNPKKADFIILLVLGIVGIFLGMGLIAGVLIIIGAIIGMVNSKK